MGKIIGREEHKATLDKAYNSDKSELIAVYGRRRVGKTYLIREYYGANIKFEVSGVYDGTFGDLLQTFNKEIRSSSVKYKDQKDPKNWLEAFEILENYLDDLKGKKKKVIFIDEFPWFATAKSRFLGAFENFWNNYATKRNDLVIVVCGSAASYMIKNIIQNKGGLSRRLTARVHLYPFTLKETDLFLKSKNIDITEYSTIQLYMMIGGIPQYLNYLERGESVTQAIDRMCFEQNGELSNEFEEVFQSLFDNSNMHTKIVRALSTSRKGLSRDELLNKTGYNSNQLFTDTIEELRVSGFVTKYSAYKKKRFDSHYRLSDEYSLFYLKFIEENKNEGKGTWIQLAQSQSYTTWSGFSFETLCLKHIGQIKKGLKIEAIHSTSSSWSNDKAQIDLLIDRKDDIINICELKFYNGPVTIDSAYSAILKNKVQQFKTESKTTSTVYLTMITTYGVTKNKYSNEVMDNELKMDVLFE